jgi:hypothetical protein
MPVINGVYLKDFTALPGAVADADIIPIAITGDNVAYRTTVAGIVTDARITAKLLTGLSVTGGAVIAADTILEAFGKVQNQINGKQGTVTLTTTGTSGASTLIANTLNIPQYQGTGNYITSLTGEATASGPGAAAVTLTNSAVIGKVLTGLNVTGGTVLAADSILDGFGKVQNQINGLIGGSIFQGTWNASTNTPTLVSSVGTNGYYYIVSVAGSTNLDGITDWKVGDWAIFAGAAWEKVDNTDSVSSVNGFTGAVSLTTDDISEGASNLYYTDARARASVSLTTTGTSGASTYDSGTGVFNIPTYADAYVGTVTSVAAITLGTTGTDLSSTVANGTTTPVITLQVPTASASNRGALSSADWSTFNGKQSTITLTTTGTSGAATLVSNTLNIPNYADGGVLSLSAIGGTANANAATITGTVLNLQPADASFGGVVTTGTQTFAGSKTFNNDIYVIGGAEVYGLSAIGEYDGGAQIPPAYGGNYALTLGSGLTANGLSLYATGKGYFVGQLRLDSTITNGTYTYTLPSATGTLALTSALTGYLPLSGGTLTGALSGTSATFSSSVALGQTISTVTTNGILYHSTNNNLYIQGGSAGVAMYSDGSRSNASIVMDSATQALYFGTVSTTRLTIASTGAATFINGAAKLFEIASNTATGGYTRFTYNTSTSIGYIGSSSQLSGSGIVSDLELRADNNLFLTTTGGSLKLASTGEATFSSTLTVASGRTVLKSTSDIYALALGYSSSASAYFYIGASADSSPDLIFSNGSPTERMRITSGGNVGIGTTSPSSFNAIANQLVVGNGTANQGITISTSTTTLGSLLFADSTVGADAYRGYVQYDHSLDKMSLATNGVAKLTIASTGAATFSGPTVTIGSAVAATNVKLFLNGVASKAAGIEFQQSGVSQWYIGNGIASEDNNFELYNSNGTMAMKIIKSTNAIAFTGAATFSSTIKTGAPSGGTAQPFKIGSVSAGGPTIVNKLEVEINGVLYTIPCSIGTIP